MKWKERIFIILCISLSGLLLVVSGSFAQSKTGTTIAQFLKIEPSSRAAAMGNAGTSLSGEATAAFYNPAALGRMQKTQVQFTYSQWLADIQYNYGVVALNLGSIGNLLLNVTSLNSGEIDVRTVSQPLGTGERFSVSAFGLGLGYARLLTDRISVGVQFTYFDERIWHSTAPGFAMNLGVQYEVAPGGFTLGASISNFGARTQYSGRDLYVDYDFDPAKHGDNNQLPSELRTDSYPLPTVFRVGMSYPVKINADNDLI